jgi:hypothetical protein
MKKKIIASDEHSSIKNMHHLPPGTVSISPAEVASRLKKISLPASSSLEPHLPQPTRDSNHYIDTVIMPAFEKLRCLCVYGGFTAQALLLDGTNVIFTNKMGKENIELIQAFATARQRYQSGDTESPTHLFLFLKDIMLKYFTYLQREEHYIQTETAFLELKIEQSTKRHKKKGTKRAHVDKLGALSAREQVTTKLDCSGREAIKQFITAIQKSLFKLITDSSAKKEMNQIPYESYFALYSCLKAFHQREHGNYESLKYAKVFFQVLNLRIDKMQGIGLTHLSQDTALVDPSMPPSDLLRLLAMHATALNIQQALVKIRAIETEIKSEAYTKESDHESLLKQLDELTATKILYDTTPTDLELHRNYIAMIDRSRSLVSNMQSLKTKSVEREATKLRLEKDQAQALKAELTETKRLRDNAREKDREMREASLQAAQRRKAQIRLQNIELAKHRQATLKAQEAKEKQFNDDFQNIATKFNDILTNPFDDLEDLQSDLAAITADLSHIRTSYTESGFQELSKEMKRLQVSVSEQEHSLARIIARFSENFSDRSGNWRTYLLHIAKDKFLCECISDLYRASGKKHDGGTASGLFYEAETGDYLSPCSHYIKACDYWNFLGDVLRTGSGASLQDRALAFSLRQDLDNAIRVAERSEHIFDLVST